MSTVYMQLQMLDPSSKIIPSGSIVQFNTIKTISSESDISYDMASGRITISRSGSYFVKWLITAEPAENMSLLALVDSIGRTIVSDSPLETDQVIGSAIITASSSGMRFSLQNISGGDIHLGSGTMAVGLTIYSVAMEEPAVAAGNGGAVINFSNGGVDIFNPLTYPILLDVLHISPLLDKITGYRNHLTASGLEALLALPSGILSNFSISSRLGPVLTKAEQTFSELAESVDSILNLSADAGLISMDSYIGHANVGAVPAIAGADLPVLSLIAGPPYPQIIAGSGNITSFAAEYECLAAIDISLLNLLPGILTTVNELINDAAGLLGTLIITLGSLITVFEGLGAPLPSDYADIINSFVLSQVNAGTPETNHHVYAVLWHGTPRDYESGLNDVSWKQVASVDLGTVKWLELAPADVFLASIGDIAAAAGNVLTAILTLLTSKGSINTSPKNNPFMAGKIAGLNHPVSAGDYLMVQFTLAGGDNTTLIAGVLAPNLMASVTVE